MKGVQMIIVGLEKEMFLTKSGIAQVIPDDIPQDDNGLLAEARGMPFGDVYSAVYNLIGEVKKISDIAKKRKYKVSDSPSLVVSRETLLLANRTHTKGLLKYQNMYGFKEHNNKPNEVTAGVHISFTNQMEMFAPTYKTEPVKYNGMFDYVQIFKALDEAFEAEIKESRRNKGFYELKADGRIEYRSLPSNVNLTKVISVLRSILNK
jgi:hypothetical protein